MISKRSALKGLSDIQTSPTPFEGKMISQIVVCQKVLEKDPIACARQCLRLRQNETSFCNAFTFSGDNQNLLFGQGGT